MGVVTIKRELDRMLAAAKRNITDVHGREISAGNRFEADLQANGLRILTRKPGHHATMIRTLIFAGLSAFC